MPRSSKPLFVFSLAIAMAGCAPPPELSEAQSEQVGRCLKLELTQETGPECAEVTKPMRKAFLSRHPDFYENILDERKAFVAARIAEDQRRHDELSLCIDEHEAGKAASPVCEKFLAHEIKRGVDDRRRKRCAVARLDSRADARQLCEGFSEREIESELELERARRKRRDSGDER